MQAKEIDKLKAQLKAIGQGQTQPSNALSQVPSGSTNGTSCKGSLRYLRRVEILSHPPQGKSSHHCCLKSINDKSILGENRDKYCRLLCYNSFYGMLMVSQPSFTALAPGFGVRKVNLLEDNSKAGAFISLHK